jgi:hypothetical protein
MSVSLLFICGLTLTLLVSLAVVRYLNLPLRRQLQELCGSTERAEFWTAFSNVAVALVPVIFAMQFQPHPEAGAPPLLAVVGQLKWGLLGLVSSVLVLGWILSRFIPRAPIPPPAWAAGQKQG